MQIDDEQLNTPNQSDTHKTTSAESGSAEEYPVVAATVEGPVIGSDVHAEATIGSPASGSDVHVEATVGSASVDENSVVEVAIANDVIVPAENKTTGTNITTTEDADANANIATADDTDANASTALADADRAANMNVTADTVAAGSVRADGSANAVAPINGEEVGFAMADVDVVEGELPFERPKIVYHITDFDGPLDLLYRQIKDAKIDIEDIFISDITSQYIQIIRNAPKEELDYEYAGEFIVMAAELVYLKSLRGLPKDEEEELDEDDPAYERQLFINKLKQYALLKEQSEKLREMETINRFYRQPTYTDKDYRVALVNFSLPKLVEAFAKVLASAERRGQEVIPKKVMKDRFSVHEQMEYIRRVIAERLEMEFTELFEPDYDKSDIVTTFLATLELVKYGIIGVTQEETFGVIMLHALDNTADAVIVFEEGDDGKY